jgi:hypothetical protein
VGYEPTIPAFEQAKTVHALDHAATVIGTCSYTMYTNTVFSAALYGVPGSNTPFLYQIYITCVALIRTSSGVYDVAQELLHCGHSDHVLRTQLTIIVVLKI